MSRSIHAAQGESLPYNHHLHQFLTFLKHERGFADATIVNRERSLKPFLGWLVAEDVPLSTVSPVVLLGSPEDEAFSYRSFRLRTECDAFAIGTVHCCAEARQSRVSALQFVAE